jgi:hypothetical protein
MDWKPFGSVAALALSLISFARTYRPSAQSAVTSVRPVLVFEYRQAQGWSVRNVGNGPALNVVVARPSEAPHGRKPVRTPPLANGGRFKLTWIGLVCPRIVYTDLDTSWLWAEWH